MRHFFWWEKKEKEFIDLPVDEGVALLSLLKEVHEFTLCLSQVVNGVLVAVSHWQSLVLCQPLVGIHDFETHLIKSVVVIEL